MKLYYFDFHGRAEASRLILTVGKVPFEDVFVGGESLTALKPKLPQGQVPALELEDGRFLVQSGAIERYTAKLAGLYPADPIEAAFAESIAFLVGEMFDAVAATLQMPEGSDKLGARATLIAGKLKDKLELFAKIVGDGPFAIGAALSFVDLIAMGFLGFIKSGFVDGFPATILDGFPAVKAYFNRVASVDAVKAYYATANASRAAFKPE